jgi:signal transduction histidine kinase
VQNLAADPAGPEPLQNSRTARDRGAARGPAQTAEPRRDIVTTTRAILALCLVIVLAAYPLTAVVGLDLDAALAPARSYGGIITTITAVTTILLCGLVGYLVRAIRHRAEREIELSEQGRELLATNNRLQVDVALRREAEQRLRVAQEMLRDAVDSISEAFVIFDADDRLVMCNEAYRRLYPRSVPLMDAGARFEDLLRHGLADGLYPDAVGREEAWLAHRIREHHHPTGAVEGPLSDGRWVLITERPMRNGGVAGLRIDITRLKRGEAELRRARDNLNRAQRIARTGSNLRDLATGSVEWSDEAYRIIGVDPATFIPNSENFPSLVVPEDRWKVLAANVEADAGHCPEPIEYRIRRPSGELRHIRHESELVYDCDGKPAAVADVLHDVTELRAAEARQRELEHQLRHSQKLEALGTLAGGIAHDLNNTLSPIVVLSKLLLANAPAGSQQQRDLETVLHSARHGRELVRSILGFSRKQEGVIGTTDMAATVRETVQMLRATVPGTVTLIEDLAEIPPVMGNASQLQQAIVNLVNNAVQAIGDGTGTVTVKLFRQHRQAGDLAQVCLSVRDTGRGMDAAMLGRVFEPFFTTKPVGEGTGLGLSLVHGIVTAHNGRIEVHSEPAKGTEFVVTLPAAPDDEPEIVAAAA